MTDDWVTVAESGSLIELQDLRERLRDHGIRAEIPEQLGTATGMTDVYGLRRRHTLCVPKAQEAEARALLGTPQSELPPDTPRHRKAADWPTCPDCGKPRLAVCPYCETAGNEFLEPDSIAPEEFTTTEEACSTGECGCGPQTSDVIAKRPDPTADDGEGYVEDAPNLVICPSCDEPFRPRMANRCPWCNHSFPDGIPVSPERLADHRIGVSETEPAVPTWKIAIAVVVLGVLLGGLLVGFLNV
ncbi:hypothetical protein JCM19992_14430 [Thermostilla marina]